MTDQTTITQTYRIGIPGHFGDGTFHDPAMARKCGKKLSKERNGQLVYVRDASGQATSLFFEGKEFRAV